VIDRRSGLPSDNVNTIERFRDFVAIGTSAGLSLLDLKTGNLTNYNASHGLIDEQILCLKNQDDQSLWVGAQGGLLRFDGERFEYFSVAGGNNANHIRCIVKDREDNIWLGTHSGLYRYRDKSFCTFETEGKNRCGSRRRTTGCTG
jgi:ligand-binding sensor domain-containing protein